MVCLNGVEVVQDGASALAGDNKFTLEGEVADLVDGDPEQVGCFECGDLVGHGVSLIVQLVGMGCSQVWVANVGRCLWPAG